MQIDCNNTLGEAKTHLDKMFRERSALILQTMFRGMLVSQFPHRSVNLLSILVIVKDKLTDLRGS